VRKSDVFLLAVSTCVLLLGVCVLHAARARAASSMALKEMTAMVRSLELTDLCLFTEARYTRHLSQADLNTPFQDYPMSLEHYPSGSLVMPPETIRRIGAHLD
jgi:hypothetical protein